MNTYKCKHCGQILKRASNKYWIKSFCEKQGKDVRLILQPKI